MVLCVVAGCGESRPTTATDAGIDEGVPYCLGDSICELNEARTELGCGPCRVPFTVCRVSDAGVTACVTP